MTVRKYEGLTSAMQHLGNTYDAVADRNRLAPIEAQQASLRTQQIEQNRQGLADWSNTQGALKETGSSVSDAYSRGLKPGTVDFNAFVGEDISKSTNPKTLATGTTMLDLLTKNSPNALEQSKAEADRNFVSKIHDDFKAGAVTAPQADKLLQSRGISTQGWDVKGDVIEHKSPDGTVIATSIKEPGTNNWKTSMASSKASEQWSDPYPSIVGGKEVLLRKNLTTGKVEQVSAGPGGMGGAASQVDVLTEEAKREKAALRLVGKMKESQAGGSSRVSVQANQVIDNYATELSSKLGWDAGDRVTAPDKFASYAKSIANQEKQLGMMESFVINMAKQVDRFGELSKDLATFDTRLLNTPLRELRGRVAGSALQAKYDMYLAEIESEIGKLSSGSAASVRELSEGAREKWERIHDKSLSVADMVSLLSETKHAGEMRLDSVKEAIKNEESKMRSMIMDPSGNKKFKELNIDLAKDYLQKANGNKAKAKELALKDGYTF